MSYYLHLDSSLRNWIFFPITILTILVNLLVKYLTIYLNQGEKNKNILQSTNTSNDFTSELQSRDSDIKVTHALKRTAMLKQNYMNISEKGFKLRKAYFCNKETGYLTKEIESKAAELMNPNMMGDMIKKNAINMLYYALIFVGCGYFFGGFILLKLPFGLTQKFRSMLQQGLNIQNLDVSYVSAISWCFMLVFGLNTIIQHFDSSEDFNMLKEQEKIMTTPMQGFGPQEKDYMKIMRDEKENIEILPFFSTLEDSIDIMINKYSN